jgi:urease accessory protein UreH
MPDARADGDATGFDDGEAAGLFEGDEADFEGVAAGFTSTSAAKRVSAANAAAARVNQSLNIECLRNAVLALSQDQFFVFEPGSTRGSNHFFFLG